MHQNITYAPPPPPSPARLLPRHGQLPAVPAQCFAFSPFHPPSGQLQLELPPPSRELEPSLTLSLLQPDSSIRSRDQPRIEHSFGPPARPSSVGAFDLEQPLLHADQSEHSMLALRSAAGNDQIAEEPSMQQLRSLKGLDNHPVSLDKSASSEQVERSQSQLVPESDFSPHVQSDERLYPLPMASHDAVVQDKFFFMKTLDNFLAAFGTRLT